MSFRFLVSLTNKKTKKDPIKLKIANPKKVYSCIVLISSGVVSAVIRVNNQFRNVPTATPLSFITSLMYIQHIGPGPNSNAAMNNKEKISVNQFKLLLWLKIKKKN